jgi:hypothetical protein
MASTMTKDINNVSHIGFDLGLRGLIDKIVHLVVEDYNVKILKINKQCGHLIIFKKLIKVTKP